MLTTHPLQGLLNPDCTEALAAAIKDGQVNERFPEKTILLEGGSTAEECMERCRKYILRMEELQVPIRRSDMGIQGTQFMLQRPTPLLRQLVGAMLDEMDFQPRQGRLRVTLHVRTLHRPGAEAAKKWDNEYFRKHMDCARRKIGEEQARLGVSPNNTVVFMATDKRSLLDTVAQELRSVTHRVVLPPAEGPAEKFFDSRNALADDARIRQFMTEWVIFGEGDYALGTAGSSFSMFATLRLGRFMVAMPSDFNPDLCDPLVVITKKSYFDVHY